MLSLFITVVAVLLLVIKRKWFSDWLDYLNKGRAIPGPKALPLIGNLHQTPKDGIGFFNFVSKESRRVQANGGELVRLWVGPTLVVVPLTGRAAKNVLDSNEVITKGVHTDILLPWLGTGLLLSTGTKWHGRRKMLTPVFHFRMLHGYLDVFNDECRTLVERIRSKTGSTGTTTIDLHPLVKHAALDIICRSAMGVSVDAQHKPEDPYVRAVETMSNLVFEIMFAPWLNFPIISQITGWQKRYDDALAILLAFTKKVVKERLQHVDEIREQSASKKHLPFLDLLIAMRDEHNLTDEDLREEVDTFMFEGHDTTAHGITWTLWCLACHPQIQEQVHLEVSQVFDDGLSIDVVNGDKLRLLDACTKEAMRIYPPVPFVQRRVTVDDLSLAEKSIPRGANIVIAPCLIHVNENIWEKPYDFIPDRWLGEKRAQKHAYDYIPFSAGPRNCIGQKFAVMEEKVMLVWLLRHFRFTTDIPMDVNRRVPEVIMKPELGLPLTVEYRL